MYEIDNSPFSARSLLSAPPNNRSNITLSDEYENSGSPFSARSLLSPPKNISDSSLKSNALIDDSSPFSARSLLSPQKKPAETPSTPRPPYIDNSPFSAFSLLAPQKKPNPSAASPLLLQKLRAFQTTRLPPKVNFIGLITGLSPSSVQSDSSNKSGHDKSPLSAPPVIMHENNAAETKSNTHKNTKTDNSMIGHNYENSEEVLERVKKEVENEMFDVIADQNDYRAQYINELKKDFPLHIRQIISENF